VSSSSGLETPDAIDLRKKAGQETPDVSGPKELYKVIEQRDVSGTQGLFGSSKQYMLGNRDVQIAINPDELEEQIRDEDALKERYEAEIEVRGAVIVVVHREGAGGLIGRRDVSGTARPGG
jgi:hypothetical protein